MYSCLIYASVEGYCKFVFGFTLIVTEISTQQTSDEIQALFVVRADVAHTKLDSSIRNYWQMMLFTGQ